MNFLENFKIQHINKYQDVIYINFTESDDFVAYNENANFHHRTLELRPERITINANYDKSTQKDLSTFGIDVNSVIKLKLKNEYKHDLCAKIIKECRKNAVFKSKYEIKQTRDNVKGLRKILWDFFGYHPDVWVESDDFFNVLCDISTKVCDNSINECSRWVLINPSLSNIFTNNEKFWTHLDSANDDYIVNYIGNWKNLKIYTSHIAQDNQILIGRSFTSDFDYLVSILIGDDEWFESIDSNNEKNTILSLTIPTKVFSFPSSSVGYIKWNVQKEKPSLRRWLWDSLTKNNKE